MGIENRTIDVNAHISNVTTEVTVQNALPTAVISFDNLRKKSITAVEFDAIGYNSFEDPVVVNGNTHFSIIIQDVSVKKNTRMKKAGIPLPDNSIRRISVAEKRVYYDDGTSENYTKGRYVSVNVENYEEGTDEEKRTLSAIQNTYGKSIRFHPVEFYDGWICGCGRYNPTGSEACSLCGNKKEEILRLQDDEHIKSLEAKFDEDTAAKTEADKKTRKKRIILAAVGVVLAVFIAYCSVVGQRKTYPSEEDMKYRLHNTTYTMYDNDGEPSYQIYIGNDTVIKRWCNLGKDYDMQQDIDSWNPKKGVIEAGIWKVVVKNDGNIKVDGDVYEKGGSFASTAGGRSNSSYTTESASSALTITSETLTSNSLYTIYKGTLKNTGSRTYTFVQLKGAFKNRSGDVIDTDWTYAVGSEGLAPGESTTFEISVDKNYDIESCSISLLDYD